MATETPKTTVRFARFSASEKVAVKKIVDRGMELFGHRYSHRTMLVMDISAVHATTPLRLHDLAEAADFDFAHDVGGITTHLNRETGTLEDCFVPRHAVRDGSF